MQTVQIVKAQARILALLAAMDFGQTTAVARQGKRMARIVPDRPRMAADLFRPLWEEPDVDLEAPQDLAPEPSPVLD